MSYKVNYLPNPNHAITVDVVGAGGTGSFLVSRLARLNHALLQMNHPGLHVSVYDDDKVEAHNVGRQNFYGTDVNDYKSMNIVEKCNVAYGTNWEAYRTKHDGVVKSNVLFCCVDNVAFRKLIRNRGKIKIKGGSLYKQGFYLFDCGNGKDFGQVVVSELFGKALKDTIDLFPKMMSQDTEEIQRTRGCSYAEKLEEQSLFINDFIAAEACDLFFTMLTSSTIEHQGVVINQKTLRKQPIKI